MYAVAFDLVVEIGVRFQLFHLFQISKERYDLARTRVYEKSSE
jgi:hypothetical protein